MITLSNYLTENNINHITQYTNTYNSDQLCESIFKKIDIYNRNAQLIAENKYRNLPTDTIYFTVQEQNCAKDIMESFQSLYLANYLSEHPEITEGFVDENNNFISESLEDDNDENIKNKLKSMVEKIPSAVKDFYIMLASFAKSTIKRVVDFIKALGKIFSKLGNSLSEALEKLGFYKEGFVNQVENIHESQLNEDNEQKSAIQEILGENGDNPTNVYLVRKTVEAIKDKSIRKQYNESLSEIKLASYYKYYNNSNGEQIDEGIKEIWSWLKNLFGGGPKTEKEIEKTTQGYVKNTDEYIEDIKKILEKIPEKKDREQIIINLYNSTVSQSGNSNVSHSDISNKSQQGNSSISQSSNSGDDKQSNNSGDNKQPNNSNTSQSSDSDKKSEVVQQIEKTGIWKAITRAFNKIPDKTKKIIKTTIAATVATGTAVGLGISGMGLLPLALLVGGLLVYGVSKGLTKIKPIQILGKHIYKGLGKFANTVYDNGLLRPIFGVSKRPDKSQYDSNWEYYKAVICNIILNCALAWLVTMVVKIVVANLLGAVCGASIVALIVAAILMVRGIMSALINRILAIDKNNEQAEKETTLPDDQKKHKVINVDKEFFDVMTFISIFASIGTFIYSTEAGKRAIEGAIKWLWKYDLKGTLLGKEASDAANEIPVVSKTPKSTPIANKEQKIDTPKGELKVKSSISQKPYVYMNDKKIRVLNPRNGQYSEVGDIPKNMSDIKPAKIAPTSDDIMDEIRSTVDTDINHIVNGKKLDGIENIPKCNVSKVSSKMHSWIMSIDGKHKVTLGATNVTYDDNSTLSVIAGKVFRDKIDNFVVPTDGPMKLEDWQTALALTKGKDKILTAIQKAANSGDKLKELKEFISSIKAEDLTSDDKRDALYKLLTTKVENNN